MELSGAKVVITGGAGGIGSALVRRLLSAGATVAVIDLSGERIARLRQQIEAVEFKTQLHCEVADVAGAEQLAAAFGRCVEVLGGIDVQICAAAVLVDGVVVGLGPGGVRRYDLEAWTRQVNVNLTGSFLTAQFAAEQMIRSRTKGCIVLFSSISRHGRAGQACYGATKAGVASLAVSLSCDLSPYGIRAFAVAPGLTETEMALSIPDGRRQDFLDNVLANRMGTPEEIAQLTVAALSNDYYNATVLDVHGGFLGG